MLQLFRLMSALPQCQNVDLYENAYVVDDCIVLKDVEGVWKEYLSSQWEITLVKGNRYFFFPPDKGLWRCHTHMNIACIIPVRHTEGDVNSQLETIIKYMALTAKRTSQNYKIANRVCYTLSVYLPKDSVIKGFVALEGTASKTKLEESIDQAKEYRYVMVFNEKWELVREEKPKKQEIASFFSQPTQAHTSSPLPATFQGFTTPSPTFSFGSSTSTPETFWPEQKKPELAPRPFSGFTSNEVKSVEPPKQQGFTFTPTSSKVDFGQSQGFFSKPFSFSSFK